MLKVEIELSADCDMEEDGLLHILLQDGSESTNISYKIKSITSDEIRQDNYQDGI